MAKQTRKVTRRATVKKPNGSVRLNDTEMSQITTLDQRISMLKRHLADAEIQADRIRQQKQKLVEAIVHANTELEALGQSLIAPYKKSDDERWQLNIAEKTLTKT